MNNKILVILLIMVTAVTCIYGVMYDKNPYRAMLYSAIIPGGGQLYNQAYLKTAAVIGLQAYLVNSALYNYDRKEHFRKLMNGSGDGVDLYYKSRKDHYSANLRSDSWWIGTVLALSVADAFVDAHLYNYKDEKNKVRLKFEGTKLGLELRF
jgi:hypothetical protein